MKFVLIAASSILFASTSAFAGGFNGSHYAGSPQFADSAAVNYVHQTASIKSKMSKGSIDQDTGASAEASNASSCGCAGKQVAKATSKNTSFQVATIQTMSSHGSINQSSVSTAMAHNYRGN